MSKLTNGDTHLSHKGSKKALKAEISGLSRRVDTLLAERDQLTRDNTWSVLRLEIETAAHKRTQALLETMQRHIDEMSYSQARLGDALAQFARVDRAIREHAVEQREGEAHARST